MHKIHRYITCGIRHRLDLELIANIWKILEEFILRQNIVPDYLQIFQLNTIQINGEYLLRISHHQEMPSYKNEEAFKMKVADIIEEKVYIISDCDEAGNAYKTMLLASEY